MKISRDYVPNRLTGVRWSSLFYPDSKKSNYCHESRALVYPICTEISKLLNSEGCLQQFGINHI